MIFCKDIGALLSDSFTYAQEALVGKWTRWAIFILCALPFWLIQFTFDPRAIIRARPAYPLAAIGTDINWGAIPWGQIAFLAGLGFILSFFISGYTVRIYRGTTPAPDFTGWTGLFVDGIRLAVVWFLWINILPGRLQTNVVVPLAPDRCRITFRYYYADVESDGARRMIERDLAFSDDVQQEDVEICERVQEGLESGVYDRGRFSADMEMAVHHFQSLLKRTYRAHRDQ